MRDVDGMDDGRQARQDDEERQEYERIEAAPWTEMSASDIEHWLSWHPTYFMTPKQASDWHASVERLIRRDLNKYNDPSQWPDDWSLVGGTAFFRGVPEANPDRSGDPTYAERRK